MTRRRLIGTVSLLPYVSTACMFAKLASLILFSFSDPVYGVAFAVLSLLQLLLLSEPAYHGPDNVLYFHGEELNEELARDRRVAWLVEMYAPWNAASVDFASCFAELSARFSLDNLRFGKVDVSRCPNVAAKYKVNTSFMSKQLPTVILFRDGRECDRRPLVSDNGRLVKFAFNFVSHARLLRHWFT